jgi:hypothetical protein
MKILLRISIALLLLFMLPTSSLALDGLVTFGTFFDQQNVRARPDGGLASYKSEVEIGHGLPLLTGQIRPFLNFITLMDEYNDDGSFHPASIRYTAGLSWEKPLSKRLSFFTCWKHYCWHPVDAAGTVEQANYFEVGFRF